jgi:glycosyltransferase involved in cell wall biosynthesis
LEKEVMNSNEHILSIIIPAYNVAPYIGAAIESALAQTVADLEVIVVDDGSMDATPQILRELANAKCDPRLRIFSQQNGGLAEARNTGIKHARGKYLGFLDGDDLWRPNKAERHLAVLAADPTIVLSFSDSEYLTENGFPTGRYQLADCAEPTLVDMIRRNHVGNGSSPIVRSEAFEQVGLFHKECWGCEDYEMWCRLVAAGMRAKLIPGPLTLYRERPASMSHSEKFVAGGQLAITNLRAALPELPDKVFRIGLAENYRIAALKAVSLDKRRAAKYLLIALHHYPSLITNWRALGTIASIVIPAWLRTYFARLISDLRLAHHRRLN